MSADAERSMVIRISIKRTGTMAHDSALVFSSPVTQPSAQICERRIHWQCSGRVTASRAAGVLDAVGAEDTPILAVKIPAENVPSSIDVDLTMGFDPALSAGTTRVDVVEDNDLLCGYCFGNLSERLRSDVGKWPTFGFDAGAQGCHPRAESCR